MLLSQGLHISFLDLLNQPIEDVNEYAELYVELVSEQNKQIKKR
jgi:hypothetical protein